MPTKVEITVKPRPSAKKRSEPRKKKGPIKPTKKRDDLGRRRLKKRGLVNFYDFGFLKNVSTGLYEDIPFIKYEVPAFGATVALSNTEIQVRDTLVFSVPENQWSNRFRQVTRNDVGNYPFGLVNDAGLLNLGDPSIFTDNGIKFPDDFLSSDNVAFSNAVPFIREPAFYPITFKGPNRNRVTSIYDFNAPDVGPVSLSGTVDVFLMPKIYFAVFSGVVSNIAPAPARFYQLNWFYLPTPRRHFLDSSDQSHSLYLQQDVSITNPSGGVPDDYADYAAFLPYLNFQKSLPNARGFAATEFAPTFAASSINDLPQPEMVPPQIGLAIGTMTHRYLGETDTFAAFPSKPLIAVVIKDGVKKFIWGDAA